MTVLITRPISDSIALKNRLEKYGIPCFVEPMIDILIYKEDLNINFHKFDALVFTSKNAVSYVQNCDLNLLKDKICFAIGETTKRALIHLGFQNVFHAHGKIENLIHKILSKPQLSNKTIYLRGKTIKHDLKEILKQKQFICDEKICYEAIEAKFFTNNLLDMINRKQIQAVILCSYNTANTFFKLCDHYNVANCLKASKIIAVGEGLYSSLRSSNASNVVLFNGYIAELQTII